MVPGVNSYNRVGDDFKSLRGAVTAKQDKALEENFHKTMKNNGGRASDASHKALSKWMGTDDYYKLDRQPNRAIANTGHGFLDRILANKARRLGNGVD